MKKPKTFRLILIVSYILIILTVGVLFTIFHYIAALELLEDQTLRAVTSVKTLAKHNYKLQKSTLEPLAKDFVKLKADIVCNEIAKILKNVNDYSFESLNDNKKLKSLADQQIFTENHNVGYTELINKKGIMIFHPESKYEGKDYTLYDEKYPEYCDLIRNALTKEKYSGFYYYNPPGSNVKEKKFLASVRIPNTPLYIIATVYVHEYLTAAYSLIKEAEEEELNILVTDLESYFSESIKVIVVISILILIILTLIFIVVALWFSKSLSEPVTKLNTAVLKLGQGDFTATASEEGTIETRQLAHSFNQLGTKLQKYMADLEKEIKARHLIESEIKIARDIQRSILPSLTKEFKRNEFSLYAELEPARDVAGDFFDFFYLNKDKTKIAILIGDVSGKGIPAAFFMGVVKTIVRDVCLFHASDDPGKALTRINDIISIDNAELMFVSLFLIYYDIETGEILYANAGHHETIILKSKAGVEKFGKLDNVLLGFFPDQDYKTGVNKIGLGDSFILYTDGITEAVNSDGEMYGEDRLDKIICQNRELEPEVITNSVLENVKLFQNNILFDDITFVIFKREE